MGDLVTHGDPMVTGIDCHTLPGQITNATWRLTQGTLNLDHVAGAG